MIGAKYMSPEASAWLRYNTGRSSQEFAVCVENQHWDSFEFDGTPIPRDMLVYQLMADLVDGDRLHPLVRAHSLTFRTGTLVGLSDFSGKPLPTAEYGWFIAYANARIAKAEPPMIAVREDGRDYAICVKPPNRGVRISWIGRDDRWEHFVNRDAAEDALFERLGLPPISGIREFERLEVSAIERARSFEEAKKWKQ